LIFVSAGAAVFVDGASRPVGVTPLLISLERGSQPRQLLLRASGYEDQVLEVIPDRDGQLRLTLTPLPRAPGRSAPLKSRK
jgi:hypothetical protein